jgi:cold shock CspA family protein
MQASVHRFDDHSGSGSVLLDDGRELRFEGEVFDASGLRHVRPGQRVSVETSEGVVTRLWIVGVGPDQPIR